MGRHSKKNGDIRRPAENNSHALVLRMIPSWTRSARLLHEVAVGDHSHAIHRPAEAPVAGTSEGEARLKGQPPKPGADTLPFNPQRSRWEPYRLN